jgi:hypothetical protein
VKKSLCLLYSSVFIFFPSLHNNLDSIVIVCCICRSRQLRFHIFLAGNDYCLLSGCPYRIRSFYILPFALLVS